MTNAYRGPRFWMSFLAFTLCNFLTCGPIGLRDGFLVDFFSTKRQVSGFLYGLVQSSYGIGFGITLAVSLTVKEPKIGLSRKSKFLWTVTLTGILSVLIGAGEFVDNNEVLIALDILLRLILGLVTFKNNILLTEIIEIWFLNSRDLFLGITFTVRWMAMAVVQYTGTLLYVKVGYFASFLTHGGFIFLVLAPAFFLIEHAEPSSLTEPLTMNTHQQSINEEEKSEEENLNQFFKQSVQEKDKTGEEMVTEDKVNLHRSAYPLLICHLTAVAPSGLYSIMITPYFEACCGMPVEKSSVYLTVMTVLLAVSSTAAGWLLQHISCFKLLLASSVFMIVSPILAFLDFPKIVSIVGLALYGVGGPLGILSVMPCMETIHRNATRSQVMTRAQSQIKSLWLGLWAVGGYCVSILAGMAMDYLSFTQTAFCISALELFSLIALIIVMVCDRHRKHE